MFTKRPRRPFQKKEDEIVQKIQSHFRSKELKMTNEIRDTIFADSLKVYLQYRKGFEFKINELIKERTKLRKRKKVTKEVKKLLKINAKQRLWVYCQVIQKTYLHFKSMYYESDERRLMKLLDVLNPELKKKRPKITLESIG